MKTPLAPEEQLLKHGPANLQRGAETVGGKLYLTSARLVFEPHSLNVQTQVELIPLARVARMALCWTRFLNLIPLAPNSLAVFNREGTEFRFVLFGRKTWMAAIEAEVARGGQPGDK